MQILFDSQDHIWYSSCQNCPITSSFQSHQNFQKLLSQLFHFVQPTNKQNTNPKTIPPFKINVNSWPRFHIKRVLKSNSSNLFIFAMLKHFLGFTLYIYIPPIHHICSFTDIILICMLTKRLE